jgi:hypothetical protein
MGKLGMSELDESQLGLHQYVRDIRTRIFYLPDDSKVMDAIAKWGDVPIAPDNANQEFLSFGFG